MSLSWRTACYTYYGHRWFIVLLVTVFADPHILLYRGYICTDEKTVEALPKLKKQVLFCPTNLSTSNSSLAFFPQYTRQPCSCSHALYMTGYWWMHKKQCHQVCELSNHFRMVCSWSRRFRYSPLLMLRSLTMSLEMTTRRINDCYGKWNPYNLLIWILN